MTGHPDLAAWPSPGYGPEQVLWANYRLQQAQDHDMDSWRSSEAYADPLHRDPLGPLLVVWS